MNCKILLVSCLLLVGCRARLYKSESATILSFTAFDSTSMEDVEYDGNNSEGSRRIRLSGTKSDPQTSILMQGIKLGKDLLK